MRRYATSMTHDADTTPPDSLFATLYAELRQIAQRELRRNNGGGLEITRLSSSLPEPGLDVTDLGRSPPPPRSVRRRAVPRALLASGGR